MWTVPKIKRLLNQLGVQAEISRTTLGLEVEFANEQDAQRANKTLRWGGYKTGWGGWVLQERYVDKGEYGDPSSRHHYGRQKQASLTYQALVNQLNTTFTRDVTTYLVSSLHTLRAEDVHVLAGEITGYLEAADGRFRFVVNEPYRGKMVIELNWGGGVGGSGPRPDTQRNRALTLNILGENARGVALEVSRAFLKLAGIE
jgi:hypothetical protein